MKISHILYSHNGLFNQYCSFQHLAAISGLYKDYEVRAVNNIIPWKIQDPQEYQVSMKDIDVKLDNSVSPELIDLIDFNLPNVTFFENDYFLTNRLNSNIIHSQLSYINADNDSVLNEDLFAQGRKKVTLDENKENIFTMTLIWYSKFFFNKNRDIATAVESVKFKEPYIALAQKIALSLGHFNGAHVRVMKDHFQYYTFNEQKINNGLGSFDTNAPLYISVDDMNHPILKDINVEYKYIHDIILNDFYEDFKSLPYSNRVVLGLISSLVMSLADDFIGTPLSTYTGFIHQERYRNDRKSFKFFPGAFNSEDSSVSGFSWNKSYSQACSWEREWPECYIKNI